MKQSEHSSTGPSAKKSGSASQRVDSIAPDSVRRGHERFSVDLEVNVCSEHNFYAGLAENLSAGGLFIATHKLQKVGSRIELSLRMPDSEEVFQIVGEVRWVRLYNEHSDTSPGLGIRFTELPTAATAAINRFLGQREPLFFDDE
jgi:type IV pilus assembly protein PilZ